MVAMATTNNFCDGSNSENVQGPKLYQCTKSHAFMKKSTIHPDFDAYHLNYNTLTVTNTLTGNTFTVTKAF